MIAVRAIIHGRVQGVGFRAWTVKTATNLGLKGWVRNANNGTVEAVFAGDAASIHSMLIACEKGPLMARIDKVERAEYDEPIEDYDFTAKPTV